MNLVVAPNGWEFLVQILHAYYTFISTLDYIFIQLSATLTKLCHIKCDHLACVAADGGHFAHMIIVNWVVALNGITSLKLQVIELKCVA